MIIIGADYHPSFQQIAWVDSDTGEFHDGWSIVKRQNTFTVLWQRRG